MSNNNLDEAQMIQLFVKCGLDERGAQDTARSAKLGKLLVQLLHEAGVAQSGCEKIVTVLLSNVATKLSTTAANWPQRAHLLQIIATGAIRMVSQVDAAIQYYKKTFAEDFTKEKMEEACGAYVVVTKEQIDAAVTRVIGENRAQLIEQRYRIVGKVLSQVIASLPWADGPTLKAEFDKQIEALIGVKTEEDTKKVKPAPASSTPSAPAATAAATTTAATAATASTTASADSSAAKTLDETSTAEWLAMFDGREIPEARNTKAQLATHLEATGGKVVTRFPPEPNGYLHLGHGKAMNFNFGLAKRAGGGCIMRFDDTNPDAEKLDYIENILENLTWLGHKPVRITYTSDYFQQLYELAVKLIKKGKAYVCHQTGQEIKVSRETKIPSPYRNRPIEESLKLFEDMRKGKFDEGAATLRMKGDLNHSNPQMWDMVAYRIKYSSHPHVGDKWCIYPSYDYSHCIVDSLENITHSCCTLEFEVRRESYYWLLHELDLYKPKVWEYSRLNVEYNVMSKRRLLRLVMEKHVNGWDDPRLLTLNGLRRRGYTSESIADFCNMIGVSRTENMIPVQKLEHCVRARLEPEAMRAMLVQDPVRVVLTNYPADRVEQLSVPNMPRDPSRGTHVVPLSRVVYIERSDVRLVDSKDFFGLAPGKAAHLKYAYNICADKILTDATGKITEVHATMDVTNATKVKGNLHWVAEPTPGQDPMRVELRLYENLFMSKDPMEIEDWLADLNPESLTVVENAFVDPSVAGAKPGSTFQFERIAFFVVDPDTTSSKMVLNRTVLLKESKPKSK